MNLFPDFKTFKKEFDEGRSQLVWAEFPADTNTPVSAMLKLSKASDYHLLFESVEGGKRARYSIIAKDPDLIWRCSGEKAEINKKAARNPKLFAPCKDGVFESLRALLKESEIKIPDSLPPMAAGLFGYMTYDMVRHMEKIPGKNKDAIGIPGAVYIRPQIVVIFDSLQDKALIITPVFSVTKGSAKSIYDQAIKRIRKVRKELAAREKKSVTKSKAAKCGPFTANVNEAKYSGMIRKAKKYIAAGDIYQIVPSRRWSGPYTLPPFSLYRALRSLNPSPYLFYLALGNFTLVGSSPEILVRFDKGTVTIRPIAGTRKRGKTEAEDKKLEKDLLADEKELAEHLMLLDLGRNDVGRVSKPGSVRVTQKMVVEKYSHVMHIVSNVEGEAAKGKSAIDALIAGFPAGTLTGAPKIRAMEIINELESEKRSFYGGTVGYFSSGGSMDTCIAIRTGLIKDGRLYVQAGGGIVADSKEHDEFMETENKARAVIKAAEEAKKFL